MPSIGESQLRVKESLRSQNEDLDHDAILAGLQTEIDQHNAFKNDLRQTLRHGKRSPRSHSRDRSPRPTKFRFKSGTKDPRKRRSGRADGQRRHRKKTKRGASADHAEEETAHPFPREPVDPLKSEATPQDAFRDSLFDALADDEGAAYWESVYSQPIHVYERPSVKTEKGQLEQMDENEYVAYVQKRMWERKHPEEVTERERSERKKREDEEQNTRKREEFVRRKQRAAWEKAQGWRADDDPEDETREYKFTGHGNQAPPPSQRVRQEYAAAWLRYAEAWDKLKHELLAERVDQEQTVDPSKRIPWPVLAPKPVLKANVEEFMRNAPAEDGRPVLQALKAERVRWHPDKIQQRFGGTVEEGTLELVTGIFQVVDNLMEQEKKKSGGNGASV